jgi:hypothetical protein
MTKLMDQALERVRQWPAGHQDDAAELLLALDDLGRDPVEVDDETLAAIDEALEQTERGETADPKAVAEVFARFGT